jgi:hypothetical protein
MPLALTGDSIMNKRRLVIGLGILVVFVAWYLFRPELLFVDQTVSESFPAQTGGPVTGAPTVLAEGRFHSVAHESKGLATVYKLADGKRVLRLTDFATSNGPAVYVYLVAAKDAVDSAAVRQADTIDLGPLKGNIGDQNYELPADVDLTKFQAVSIWCRRFSVNFATAPLSVPGDSSR